MTYSDLMNSLICLSNQCLKSDRLDVIVSNSLGPWGPVMGLTIYTGSTITK
jgi:hypothetical protein